MKEAIINDFIETLKKKKNTNRLDVILGIINYLNNDNYKIINNEIVEEIYSHYGFAYDYLNYCSDPYDEALRIYIENEMHEGTLNSDGVFELVSPEEKYLYVLKLCIKNMFVKDVDPNDKYSLFNKFLYELFYTQDKGFIEYDYMFEGFINGNLNDEIKEEYDLLSAWLDELNSLDKKTHTVELFDFIKVVLVNFFYTAFERTYALSKKSKEKIRNFRAVLTYLTHSIYGLSFMNCLLKGDGYISYSKFLNVFKSVFSGEDSEPKKQILKSYMSKIVKVFIVRFKKIKANASYRYNDLIYDFLNISDKQINDIVDTLDVV